MVVQKVIDKRLSTKFVNTLGDLITSSESETREKGGILSEHCSIG